MSASAETPPDPGQYEDREWEAIKGHAWTAKDEAALQRHIPRVVAGQVAIYNHICQVARDLGASNCLDIGTGAGEQYLALQAQAPGVEYAGVELYQTFHEKATAQAVGADIRLLENFLSLPWPDESFDLVTLRTILRYYYPKNGLLMLQEAWRLVAPGGGLLFWLPCRPSPELSEPEVMTVRGGSDRGLAIRWPQSVLDAWLAGKEYAATAVQDAPAYLVRK